jgi:hypothetical protein
VKKLEREATRLQGDNRSLMDVEHKLKEANAEIAKLMTVTVLMNIVCEQLRSLFAYRLLLRLPLCALE